MDKIFISSNLGGISNRLKSLVSMQRLAKKFNAEIFFYWPKNMTCYASFSDLFYPPKAKELSKKDLFKIFNKGGITQFSEQGNVIKNKINKVLFSGSWRFLFIKGEDIKNLDFNFSKKGSIIEKELINLLQELKPIKEIQVRIDDFLEKHNLSDFVGIHIRRGDYYIGGESLGAFSKEVFFENKIKEILNKNPKQRFFLCTDSIEVEKRFNKRFPKKIVIFQKTNFDKFDKRFVQEGLIDLILLSKTKQILGSYRSTFSELSWWLGGCKARIETMIDEKGLDLLNKAERKEKWSPLGLLKRVIYLILPVSLRLKLAYRKR